MGKPGEKKKRRTRKKRKANEYTRTQAYEDISAFGARFAASAGISVPDLGEAVGLRLGFLNRALDDDTGKVLKNKKTFGGRYRSTMDAQDELFSTASTRSFIEGLLGGKAKDNFDEDLWETWTDAVDLLSRLRLPTKYSGSATSKWVMQHPTGEEGFFSKAKTTSLHSRMDTERVKYIANGINAAQAAGASAEEQFKAGARAAIEFSMNFFTAPITASDVQPFSQKSGIKITDPELVAQVSARRRIKELYVELGGKLRDLSADETLEEALARPWLSVPGVTDDTPYPVAPPSPFRVATKKRSREEDEEDPTPSPAISLPVFNPILLPGAAATAFGMPGRANPFLAAPGSVDADLDLLDELPSRPTKRARNADSPGLTAGLASFASLDAFYPDDVRAETEAEAEDVAEAMPESVEPDYSALFEPSAPPMEEAADMDIEPLGLSEEAFLGFGAPVPSAPPVSDMNAQLDEWFEALWNDPALGGRFASYSPSAPEIEPEDALLDGPVWTGDVANFSPSAPDMELEMAELGQPPMTAFDQQVEAGGADEDFWATIEFPSVPTHNPLRNEMSDLAEDEVAEDEVGEELLEAVLL